MNNPDPPKPRPQLTPIEQPKGNRTAAWTLVGFVVGFILPVASCFGFVFFLIIGLSVSGGQVSSGIGVPIQVSGPLTGPAVAIVEVNGTIMSGSPDAFGTTGIATSEGVTQAIRFANQDPDVKAILLKVNSPGGSVVASDLIYQQLSLSSKPIVVLIGELGASGGYYISMAADEIYANPNSLVGSIGVISTLPNAEELFEELGIKFNVFTSGDAKDFGSLYRDMTPEEIAYWQAVIDETYEGFVVIVAEGRGMDVADVRPLADGRVFTGRQALELGLIDALGYERDAISRAASLGLIPGEPRVILYQPAGSGLLSILGMQAGLPANPLPAEVLRRILAPTLEFRWLP